MNAAHREIRFANETELEKFTEALLADLRAGKRTIKVQAADAKKYEQERLAAHDPEWLAITGTA